MEGRGFVSSSCLCCVFCSHAEAAGGGGVVVAVRPCRLFCSTCSLLTPGWSVLRSLFFFFLCHLFSLKSRGFLSLSTVWLCLLAVVFGHPVVRNRHLLGGTRTEVRLGTSRALVVVVVTGVLEAAGVGVEGGDASQRTNGGLLRSYEAKLVSPSVFSLSRSFHSIRRTFFSLFWIPSFFSHHASLSSSFSSLRLFALLSPVPSYEEPRRQGLSDIKTLSLFVSSFSSSLALMAVNGRDDVSVLFSFLLLSFPLGAIHGGAGLAAFVGNDVGSQ